MSSESSSFRHRSRAFSAFFPLIGVRKHDAGLVLVCLAARDHALQRRDPAPDIVSCTTRQRAGLVADFNGPHVHLRDLQCHGSSGLGDR